MSPRLVIVLAAAILAVVAMSLPAAAHPDSCLLAVHVGGIQEHVLCF